MCLLQIKLGNSLNYLSYWRNNFETPSIKAATITVTDGSWGYRRR